MRNFQVYGRKRFKDHERQKIFKRDGHKCQWPEGCDTGDYLTVDHIVPISKGGTNREKNLITLCRYHNQLKGDEIISALIKI